MNKKLFGLFLIFNFALVSLSFAQEKVIFTDDSITATINQIYKGHVYIRVDQADIKSINGKSVQKFYDEWETAQTGDLKRPVISSQKVFDQLLTTKNIPSNLDREWKAIKDKNVNLRRFALEGLEFDQIKKYTPDDLLRARKDQYQSILEFVAFDHGFLMTKKIFLMFDDEGEVSNISSSSSAYSETSSDLDKYFTDQDRDGLSDYDETCAREKLIASTSTKNVSDCKPTDPNNPDSDQDSWWDGMENVMGSNPNDAKDFPKQYGANRVISNSQLKLKDQSVDVIEK